MRDLLASILKPRSYDGAKDIAKGNLQGFVPIIQATLVRAALVAPGLLLMGVPNKTAIYGSLIGSANISAGLVIYYMIEEGNR
tara:strand:- start:594 stop:842 length:249 start_codon:yes stop_codon:yes gene_type:complete